ncbi:glycosyltransferase family 39 protein [Thermodesulfobacteriota bacterium]
MKQPLSIAADNMKSSWRCLKELGAFWSFRFALVLYLGSAGTLYYWCSEVSSWKIRDQLKTLSPLGLELAFWLVIVGLGVSIISALRTAGHEGTPSLVALRTMMGKFTHLCRSVSRRAWIWLGAVVLAGLLLIICVVPQVHRIYYDEQIYQNIAQNIAYTKGEGSHNGEDYGQALGSFWRRFIGQAGMCNEGRNEYDEYSCYRLEYNKEPNGWPFLLSIVFRIMGVNEKATFYTNNVLYLLGILTAFGIALLLFRDVTAGLYAALVYALTPHVLLWSNTVAVEPSAAFFPALAVLCALLFLHTRNSAVLFLTAVMSAAAVQFRPEAGMICAVILLLFILRGRDEFKRPRLYFCSAVFFVLIIPHLAHLWAVKDLGWGGSGPKFSWDYVPGNFKVNFLFYLRNMRFPVIFTVLFFLGLCLKSVRSGMYFWKEKLVLFFWFLLFWGIFVLFYAGSYNYGADVRFSVLSAMPLAVLAGAGGAFVTSLIKKRWPTSNPGYVLTALIVVCFLSFMPLVRAVTQEAWAARADHRFGRQMAELVPSDAVVLTHNPNMFLIWGKNAAQASLVTEQRRYFNNFFYKYKGGVYFHYNFWCNVNDRQQNSFCNNILKQFDCTPVVEYKEKNYKYVLYKLERRTRSKK